VAKSFNVSIIAPDRKVYEGAAQSLVVPAGLGYLGVLADHAPLLTTLTRGRITIRDSAGKTAVFDCAGDGFMRVSRNRAVLLVA
jgi:F-type H+-transporting ATPase subunit epsilon